MTNMKTKTHRRPSEAKTYQCTGFGECRMTFTRSEHLARHARKHTGEKPFKCVVPGCERAFSRFDNMIQHTAIHSKHQDNDKKQNSRKKTQQVDNNKPRRRTKQTRSTPDKTYLTSNHPYTSSFTSMPTWSSNSSYDHLSPLPTFLPSPKTLGLYYYHHPPLAYLDDDNEQQPIDLDHHDYDTSSSSGSSTMSSPSPVLISSSVVSPSHVSNPMFFYRDDYPHLMPPSQYSSGSLGRDLSDDEYQALQGLCQLSSQHYGSRTMTMAAATILPPLSIHHFSQKKGWARESSSRFTPPHYSS
ncbi:hypothetical protein BC941DRAFT_414728 [Chlamydoabsidia padenii]|nr:hypothetical protein BC941DRAFT_414728 [Chlamydoabsidia padenii]